jgi:hypothetical protein
VQAGMPVLSLCAFCGEKNKPQRNTEKDGEIFEKEIDEMVYKLELLRNIKEANLHVCKLVVSF